MELIDFKEQLEQKKRGLNVTFTSAERTYLYGKYYELTGKVANKNCSTCDSHTFKVLLNHINEDSKEISIHEQYFIKNGKQVPKRFNNDKQWIKSKL